MYILWMSIYSIYWFDLKLYSKVTILKWAITGYYQLWYFPAMIGAGILVYMLKNNPRNMLILSVLFLTIGCVIQYVGNYHMLYKYDDLINKGLLYRNALTMGFPFFSFGYMLNNMNNKNIKWIKVLIIGIILFTIEVFINYIFIPDRSEDFDLLFSIIFICVPLIVLIIEKENKLSMKNFSYLSSVIFLIHPLIILNTKTFKEVYDLNTIVYLAIIFTICIILLPFLYVINKKVRFII